MIVVRYADDTIVGFEHEHEARAFLQDLQERMGLFDLTLHPEKTRLIRFGRYAAKQRAERGEGKPEVFDFLGFTHYCTRSRKWGSFVIGRKTIKKRMLRTLEAVKMELRKRMHDPIAKTGTWVNQMLNGHLNYFAVSGNDKSLWWFCNEVRWRWLKSLKRRSQKAYSTGSGSSRSPPASSRRSAYDTHCPVTASTPKSEGRARCVSSARRDLCGGRGAILVPTATEVAVRTHAFTHGYTEPIEIQKLGSSLQTSSAVLIGGPYPRGHSRRNFILDERLKHVSASTAELLRRAKHHSR